MVDALPIRLLKWLAAAGPVSLIEVDDIECSCVLLAAQLVHAEAPFNTPPRQGTLVKPMTVWGLTPPGVSLALSKKPEKTTKLQKNQVLPTVLRSKPGLWKQARFADQIAPGGRRKKKRRRTLEGSRLRCRRRVACR